jgi:hypothetical protein
MRWLVALALDCSGLFPDFPNRLKSNTGGAGHKRS